ncbi:MAG: multidrug effflux MFS transporter [Alphaproteobacteria bacterium]
MTAQPKTGRLFFAALVTITFTGPLSVHMFLPALGAVKADLGISTAMTQLTMSLEMLAMAGATLVYGGLSDRLGRRPVLLAGLACFAAGAAVSAIAPDIWTLLAGRVLQGLGAGCGVVLARAIARDVYGLERLPQVIAWLTAAYVMGPMVAPALGGFLTDAAGWRAVLITAAAAGTLILVLVYFMLGETRAARTSSQPPMLRAYGQLLRRRRFIGFILVPGFISGAFYTHAASVSFLATEVLHRSASEYGLWFLPFPIGFIIGNLITGYIGPRGSIAVMTISGCLIALSTGLILAGLFLSGPMTMATLFIPGAGIGIAQGLAMPYAQTGATRVNPDLAGTASGAVVFCQFFIPAVLQQLSGLLADGTWVPMTAIVLGAGICALIAGIAAVTDRE